MPHMRIKLLIPIVMILCLFTHGASAQTQRPKTAGESFKNDSGGVHNAMNKGSKPVKILAVYLVEKGKPLAESVP